MRTYSTARIELILSVLCISWLAGGCSRDLCSHEEHLPAGTFRKGAVVSAHRLASEAGVHILKRGGNAVDAAVAVSYVLAVVHPQAGNIGGGGFMVIRMPNGRATAIDYREKAPGKAYRDMYLDENEKYVLKMEDIPQYREIIRDKVIHDISHDPAWYLGILIKRIGRIFSETTPVRLALTKFSINIPMSGWLLIPTLLILIYQRRWFLVKLISFTLPLSITPLMSCH